MTTGAELILNERNRQIHSEGWDAEHDDKHNAAEIAYAAFCYLTTAQFKGHRSPNFSMRGYSKEAILRLYWPWDKQWWKPSDDPIRNLVKAGALIAAEIDRLQRKKQYEETQQTVPAENAEGSQAHESSKTTFTSEEVRALSTPMTPLPHEVPPSNAQPEQAVDAHNAVVATDPVYTPTDEEKEWAETFAVDSSYLGSNTAVFIANELARRRGLQDQRAAQERLITRAALRYHFAIKSAQALTKETEKEAAIAVRAAATQAKEEFFALLTKTVEELKITSPLK